MEKLKWFFGLMAVVLIICSAWALSYNGQPTIVYVDNQRLFDGFQMKKELEQELLTRKGKQSFLADSLKGELIAMESNFATVAKEKQEQFQKEFLAKRNQWISVTQQMEAAEKELESTYTTQIWNQLNQYVQDFGEQNGFDMIIGANGDGSLMYSKKTMDITDELTTYINKRYEGKK